MTLTLREQKRLDAMRRVQEVAIDAFDRLGFDRVTVEQIAEEATVSPVSVYRWFGTKEQLVLWDEYDPPLFESIASRLARSAPLEAVRDGVAAELDHMYDVERSLILRRTKLILNEPALLAASSRNEAAMVDGLTALFGRADPDGDPFEHRVLASVAVALLTAALFEWTRLDGRSPLGDVIHSGFDTIRRLRWDM